MSMNPMMQLIDERVKLMLTNADFMTTAPCLIKKLLPNNMVEVEMISDKRKFTVPNLSGAQLEVNDEAKLGYRGYISNTTSYIIAAKGHNSVALEPTLLSSLTEGSVVNIRKKNDTLFSTIDVEADEDITAGDVVLATVTSIFPYPVTGITATYYNVLQDDSGNIYPLEARLTDGDADASGKKYGELNIVVIAGDTVADGTKLRGQIFVPYDY